METRKVPREKYKQLLLGLAVAPFFFGVCLLGFWIDTVNHLLPLFTIIFSLLSLIVFGFSGLYLEKRIIRSFKFPECGKILPNYQLEKGQYVSYFCRNCNIKFETGYSLDHSDIN